MAADQRRSQARQQAGHQATQQATGDQGPPQVPQLSKPGEAGLQYHDARALLGNEREAVLVLDGEPYRLRITSKSKLILTK